MRLGSCRCGAGSAASSFVYHEAAVGRHRSSALLASFGAVSLACTPRPEAPVPPSDTPPARPVVPPPPLDVHVGQYVFIPPGTRMFLGPDLAEPFMQQTAAGSVREVLGVTDHYVRLNTAGPDPESCADSQAPLKAFDLPIFVELSELGLLTTRAVERTYDDGTRIEVAAGTPVQRLESGRIAATVRGATFELDLPPTHVGHSAPSLKPFEHPGPYFPLEQAVSLTVGPAKVRASVYRAGTRQRDHARLPSVADCSVVEGRVPLMALWRTMPATGLPSAMPSESGVTSTESGTRVFDVLETTDNHLGQLHEVEDMSVWVVEAGATVQSSAGRQLGTVASRVVLHTAPEALGDRQCFPPPGVAPSTDVRFCVEATKVETGAVAGMTTVVSPRGEPSPDPPNPRIEVGEVFTLGHILPFEAYAAVSAERLAACVPAALGDDSRFFHRFILDVDSAGGVVDLRAHRLGTTPAEICVVEVLRGTVFPKPDDGNPAVIELTVTARD